MKEKKKQCQTGDDLLKTFVVIDVFFAIQFFPDCNKFCSRVNHEKNIKNVSET